MTDIRKLLATNIKTFRQETGMTQSLLAEKANTATHYIAMIEGCKSFPSPEMIERIALALGKDTTDLFALTQIQVDWKETFLIEVNEFIDKKIKEIKKNPEKAKQNSC